jgi:hypothetical protein
MLELLLWRCPVCKQEDALTHSRRFLQRDTVDCSACRSGWKVFRVPGGTDYRLETVAGPMAGTERPLAEWYDRAREGFEPKPLATSSLALGADEVQYLRPEPVNLIVLRPDPRFRAPIARLADAQGAAERPPTPLVNLGPAALCLTNQRIIIDHDGQSYDLDLESLRSVQLGLDRFLILRQAGRLLTILEFGQGSTLKWRAYLDATLRPIAERSGIPIRMAYD